MTAISLDQRASAIAFYRMALIIGFALSALLFIAGLSFGFFDLYFTSVWGFEGVTVMLSPAVGFVVRQCLSGTNDTPRNIALVAVGVVGVATLHIILARFA